MASAGNTIITAEQKVSEVESSMPVVIVRTQWNPEILDELERGCTDTLRAHGFNKIRVITVPGAVEIPFAVNHCWNALKYRDEKPAVFIVLACVIKGDTPHFDYVCRIVADGVTQLNLMLPVPTVFGVLTVLDTHQAWARLGGAHGHKGNEAALTAIAMISLTKSISHRSIEEA